MMEGLPECCPFCRDVDSVKWTEFKVLEGQYHYYDEGERKSSGDDVVHIFCTRCEEEIREEDR